MAQFLRMQTAAEAVVIDELVREQWERWGQGWNPRAYKMHNG